MNKKEQAILNQIYSDCVFLRLRGELTDFGEGQLELCEMILELKQDKIKRKK